MVVKKKGATDNPVELPKCPSGIQGLDEITFGGLPKGRPTLVCGAAGCGKTLLAMEFLYRGAHDHDEPGVFMAFEEKEQDLIANFASMGFDIPALIRKKKLVIDYVYIDRSEIEETGEYDLEGLFIRLSAAIDSIGAKRVVLDTVEALFSGFSNESILRAELRRLFRWLKDKGVTAVVTGEKGENLLTKHGLEEYVADCVILLDHRVKDQVATRRLKIIKYRGSRHGTNEFPFLIGSRGISVFPISSLLLTATAHSGRISSGIRGLDEMLDNKGFYRGSAILVSGSAGSGKTSIGAEFVHSACGRGERAIIFTFEESPSQIIRNMKSIGVNLEKWAKQGLLKFSANKGTLCGLEMHLVMAHDMINEFKPAVVVMDPIADLMSSGTLEEAKIMLVRLLDFLRNEGITVLITDLALIGAKGDQTEIGISSLCDAWIRLSMDDDGYSRVRRMNILKARGIQHSHKKMNMMMNGQGITIKEIPGVQGEKN